MKQYNCKNCGAPIEHTYNHMCPYCHSICDFNEPEENVVEVKAEDLVDIKLKEIRRIPEYDKIQLVFVGFKCPMPKVYEFDGNDIYKSRAIEYINPPKCGIVVELSRYEVMKYGLDYVKSVLRHSGIRYNELDKIIPAVAYKMREEYYV